MEVVTRPESQRKEVKDERGERRREVKRREEKKRKRKVDKGESVDLG